MALVKEKERRHEIMKQIISHYGPIMGAICICPELMAYSEGVYLNDQCCTDVNHAIVRTLVQILQCIHVVSFRSSVVTVKMKNTESTGSSETLG